MRAQQEKHTPVVARLAAIGVLLSALAGCSDQAPLAPQKSNAVAPLAPSANRATNATGAVFVASNAVAGNAVFAFHRAANGTLSPIGTFPTGGVGIGGTADPLASQFALTLSDNNKLLFAVNAGSNDVSVFRVASSGLELADRKSSLGIRPVSVAAGREVLYVLNAGSNSIGILRIGKDGTLTPVGTRALSAGADGAAAIRLSPNGHLLAVTERVSNTIDGFEVARNGSLGAPRSTPSTGDGPFGFGYTPNGTLVVSDAGTGAATSYAQRRNGTVSLLDGPESTGGQAAPCWVIVSKGGRFVYTANAGSGSISGFSVARDGALQLITPGGRTGDLGTGAQPLDLDLSRDGRFMYVLKNGTGTIGVLAVNGDGTLVNVADTPGLQAQAGFMGLAAY